MKQKLKKLFFPALLIVIGIGISVFVGFYNPQVATNKPVYTSQYIAVTIKDVYPFPRLFRKGTMVKTVLRKFNIGIGKNIFLKKEPIGESARLYEDTTLSLS